MKTKEVVRELLTIKPHLRDNDSMLIAAYWWRELKGKEIDPNKMNGLEFMQMFANNKLTNIKTIERMRRKLQEECPELRGKAYELRKGTIQDKWKQELGYENNK
jgi:hypothetical protein